MIQIHLWELPSDLRVTFNPNACPTLRAKLTENGYYRKSNQPWTQAARLYHQLGIDWSNRGRPNYNKGGHMHSITISDLKDLSRKIKTPLLDLEKDVTNLFKETHAKGIVGPFPIKIDENYAWLAGLWFGCGGFYEREKEVRFRTEYEVAKEIERKAGDIGCQFTVSRYMQHQAKFPRVMVILPSAVYAIFKKLGFPPHVKGYHSRFRRGRNPAAREVHLMVPAFVRRNPSLGRAFVEGYLNSTKLAVWHYKLRAKMFGRWVNAHVRGVDVRFVGPTHKKIFAFSNFVISILHTAGFKGSWHEIPNRTGSNYEFGLIITGKPRIKAFFRDFRIVKGSAQRVLKGI